MRKPFANIVVRFLFPLFVFVCSTGLYADEKSPSKPGYTIASLSFVPVKWDKEANLKTIETMAREAATAGARVIITPEGALDGYLINEVRASDRRPEIDEEFFAIAEPLDGPIVKHFIELARELKIDMVLGFLERDDDILYNSCAWITADGEIAHVHRKTHMAQPYFDPEFYHPGYELKAFDTALGRVGMLICFERQIPEVCSALAQDGAEILVNPSYGSRGEWNDIMLRTRARDSNAFLIFTHPRQTLVIDPGGKILVNKDDEAGPGIVYFTMDPTSPGRSGRLTQRRHEVFSNQISSNLPEGNQRSSRPGHIKVAAVQMRCSHDLKDNVGRIKKHLAECARQGVRVALFPECATTGYFQDEIPAYSERDLIEAERAIGDACRQYNIYCIFGTPYFKDGRRFNMALVINPQGETIYKQAKIQLVGGDSGWASPGNALSTFRIDDETCSLIICHDSRYPELVRIPVIKGARLVFYLSWESDIRSEHKIEPYRAQVVARAVENNVYIVHANAPQSLDPLEGSHGQSRIVGPDGVIIREATMLGEEMIIADLDVSRATGSTALKSLRADFLKEWWLDGLKNVGISE